jgi:hypothetical protein
LYIILFNHKKIKNKPDDNISPEVLNWKFYYLIKIMAKSINKKSKEKEQKSLASFRGS